MKTKFYNFLNKPYAVVFIMLLSPLFGFIDGNFVFFFSLGVALLILRKSKFDWSIFGMGEKLSKKTVLKSTVIAILLFTFFTFFVDPLLLRWFGDYDLSSIDNIRGDFLGYFILMIIVWVFAAFGEEFLFRGYYMKGLAALFGNSDNAWIGSAIITSLYFGISHAYQGVVGIISVFLWSFVISMIFNKNRNNLWLLILVHGIYDTIGVTLIYLNKDQQLNDWIQQLF